MAKSGLSLNQVSQIRGFADQALRDPKHPTDPSNRRVSLIVQYAGQAPLVESSAGITVIKPAAPSGAHGEAAAASHSQPEAVKTGKKQASLSPPSQG